MSKILISFIDHNAINHKFYARYSKSNLQDHSTCYWSGIYPNMEITDIQNCAFLANILLCYDTCLITVNDYLYLVRTLGLDLINTMLDEGVLEIYNNFDLKASIYTAYEDIPMIIQFSKENAFDAEKKIKDYQRIYKVSYDEKYLNNLAKTIEKAQILDLEDNWLEKLNKETSNDLKNPNITGKLGLINDGKIIDRNQDYNQFLYNRIAYLNLFMALGNKLEISNVLLQSEIQSLLNIKLGAYISPTNNAIGEKYSSILEYENAYDISKLVENETLNFYDVLRIRESKHSIAFREWLETATLNYPEKGGIELYNAAVKEGVPVDIQDSTLKKIFKWAIPIGLDLVPVVGNVSSFVFDTVSLVKELRPKKYYPNIFINDHLRAEIDTKMHYNKMSAENKAIKQKYVDISRNGPCPCGSGNKYKKCHGKYS